MSQFESKHQQDELDTVTVTCIMYYDIYIPKYRTYMDLGIKDRELGYAIVDFEMDVMSEDEDG
ncbi:uncharacterized protein EAF02_012148 [Botrytis sinoallii]|uniref:uncharacterized protein n=1 Tax=Botrytis sinoallii TaxID=1463999 RepID=UPI0019006E6F|nr:uncharacterized protein EAF02_012148 [Botrytis sinoallii]KAF7852749.1 hypothetical protein EAF02_012148 [Botrytis sinoallii]